MYLSSPEWASYIPYSNRIQPKKLQKLFTGEIFFNEIKYALAVKVLSTF